MEIDKYTKSLVGFRLIYEKYKTLKNFKSNFNVFSILLNPYDEVNLHSKFIAGILTENKYKEEFLYSLLKTIDFPIPKDLTEKEIGRINVEREKATIYGRIDIFISFSARDLEYNLLIENKLWARDGYKQMDRYAEYLDCEYYNRVNGIYYLTLDGHEPSLESCNDINKIKLISYDYHILAWINECIKIAAREPSIREILVQYESLLEEILGKNKGVIMEMKEYILKNLDNYELAVNLQEALLESKIELQNNFWAKLEERLEDLLKNKYNVAVENTIKDGTLGKYNSWYSYNIITNFYKSVRGYTNYGLMYNLGNAKDIGNLFLKVEISRSNLYFGLRKNVEPINENSDNYKKLLGELQENNYVLKDFDWWVCWKYLYIGDEVINLNELNMNLARTLMNNSKLDILVDNCIEKIEELIEILQKYM